MSSQHIVRLDPLSKENYDTWKIQMEALLVRIDLWEYVSGAKVRPEVTADPKTGEAAAAWDVADRKAKAELLLAIGSPLLKDVKLCETSKQVWNKLESIYQSRGPARKANLLKKLIINKMSSDDDMHSHLTKFFDTVDKLRDMQLEINEDLLAILLLYSLPDSYENFRIAIESRDDLPSPETLKVKMLEEFECRKNRQKGEFISGAMYIRQRSNFMKPSANVSKNGNRSNNKSNYDGDRGKKLSKFKLICYRCRRTGHKAIDCKVKLNDQEKSAITEEALTVSNTYHHAAWCLDSGATSHMCADKEKFSELKMTAPYTLHLASNKTTQILGIGTINISTVNGNNARLDDVLYVPDLRTNLLSINKIASKGYTVVFSNDEADIKNRYGKTVIKGKRIENLYYVMENIEEVNLANGKNELKIWHDKMGHLNFATIKDMIKRKIISGIKYNVKDVKELSPCEICIQGKQSRAPFLVRDGERCRYPLELVHTDICGPIGQKSIGGARYFATFIDDATRWCKVYMLKNKSEIFEVFKLFKNHAENFCGRKIKALRSDNAKEYVSSEFIKFLNEKGIHHQLSVEYTPQQNGVAERKNRTLVEMARCMLQQSKLPRSFWAEAIATANYIRNRCPSRSLNGETPYKLWMGKSPTVGHFQVFGTVAYALHKGPGRSKFDGKSKKCIFMGYCEDSKAYRLWSKETRKILKSRDVIFTDKFEEHDEYRERDFENQENEFLLSTDTEKNFNEKQPEEGSTSAENSENSENVTDGNATDENTNAERRKLRGRPALLRTGKKGRPKKIYRTGIPNEERSNDIQDENEANGESDEDFQDCVSLAVTDPQNMSEVIESPYADQWKQAMKEELNAHTKNGTWEIVERPKNEKVINCRWVFTNKFNAVGEVSKRKARLVAKGCSQRPGIDFKETFAPVTRQCSIRLLVALSVEWNLILHQLDIVTAYLNGDLEEKLYMQLPENYFELSDLPKMENKVCCLRKAIYGLKQSGRQWYTKLDEQLRKMDLVPLKSDPCVYMAKRSNDVLLVAIYVDDIIVGSNNLKLIKTFKKELADKFELKDMGKLRYCLGIEFNQKTTNEISISQRRYIDQILVTFGMEDSKCTSTPMDPTTKLTKEMCPKTEKEKQEMTKIPYQNLIGSLLYLAITTRPDISYSVSVLSQYNNNYGSQHWVAAKRVLRYLKGTKDKGLVFKRTDIDLQGYADSDWGSNTDDRRSHTGFVFKLANSCISWDARKQRTVALSSAEAEYMAVGEAVKEALYLRSFLYEVGFSGGDPVTIFNDNKSAQLLAKHPLLHSRSRHIDIRHHFIREAVQDNKIHLEYLETNKMPADVLTKALPPARHETCIEGLGLKNIPASDTY